MAKNSVLSEDGKMSKGIKNFLATICLVVLTAALIGAIGTAGAVDCDTITIGEGGRRGIILIVVMFASVFGLIKLECDED